MNTKSIFCVYKSSESFMFTSNPSELISKYPFWENSTIATCHFVRKAGKITIDSLLFSQPIVTNQDNSFLGDLAKRDIISKDTIFKPGSLYYSCEEQSKDFCNKFHGSGINLRWHTKLHNTGILTLKNTFDCMNENGYYCHSVNFTVYLHFTHYGKLIFDRVELNGQKSRNCNCLYGLQDYLNDTFSDSDYTEKYEKFTLPLVTE